MQVQRLNFIYIDPSEVCFKLNMEIFTTIK